MHPLHFHCGGQTLSACLCNAVSTHSGGANLSKAGWVSVIGPSIVERLDCELKNCREFPGIAPINPLTCDVVFP